MMTATYTVDVFTTLDGYGQSFVAPTRARQAG
jgi:hypothetical protein